VYSENEGVKIIIQHHCRKKSDDSGHCKVPKRKFRQACVTCPAELIEMCEPFIATKAIVSQSSKSAAKFGSMWQALKYIQNLTFFLH
jgi:hypothetical protein